MIWKFGVLFPIYNYSLWEIWKCCSFETQGYFKEKYLVPHNERVAVLICGLAWIQRESRQFKPDFYFSEAGSALLCLDSKPSPMQCCAPQCWISEHCSTANDGSATQTHTHTHALSHKHTNKRGRDWHWLYKILVERILVSLNDSSIWNLK